MIAALLIFIFVTGCMGQVAENQVAATLKQLERAEQTGDANTWISLWSREKQENAEKIRPYLRAQPARLYRASRIYVQGDDAAILAQAAADSFVTMLLGKEDGQWKIRDQLWRNTAADVNSVYALVPPADGAFLRGGSPWDQVAPALAPIDAARQGWQMRAVFDESFLYVRIEYGSPLPAPGSTIETPPSGWPNMKIAVAGGGEFVLFDSVNVGDQATFDKNGKANSHRAYAAYMMRLEHKDREVFSASADLQTSRLVDVTGQYFDMRIPLRAIGVTDSRITRLTIGDAQWPKSAIVSADVRRFQR